jgi:hypothetical protein
MYDYTKNGEAFYNYVLNKVEMVEFAQIMVEFSHSIFANDDCSYIVNKWYKYCDEIAEFLLYDNEDYANTMGISKMS